MDAYGIIMAWCWHDNKKFLRIHWDTTHTLFDCKFGRNSVIDMFWGWIRSVGFSLSNDIKISKNDWVGGELQHNWIGILKQFFNKRFLLLSCLLMFSKAACVLSPKRTERKTLQAALCLARAKKKLEIYCARIGCLARRYEQRLLTIIIFILVSNIPDTQT